MSHPAQPAASGLQRICSSYQSAVKVWKEKWERTVSHTVWACKARARGIQTKQISRFFGRISRPQTSQKKMRHFWAQATLGSEELACCVGRPSSFLLYCHEQDCHVLSSNSDPCFSATSHSLLSPFYSMLLFPVGNAMNYLLLVLFLTKLNGKVTWLDDPLMDPFICNCLIGAFWGS